MFRLFVLGITLWSALAYALPAPNPVAGVSPAQLGTSLSSTFNARTMRLHKRQDLSQAVGDLQNLLQSAIAGQATGDCQQECTPWIGLIQDCVSASSSNEDLGVCACQAEPIAAMLNCGMCFGAEGNSAAGNVASICQLIPGGDVTATDDSSTATKDSSTATDDGSFTNVFTDVFTDPSDISTIVDSFTSGFGDLTSDVASSVSSLVSQATDGVSLPTLTAATTRPTNQASRTATISGQASSTRASSPLTGSAPGRKRVAGVTALLGGVAVIGIALL